MNAMLLGLVVGAASMTGESGLGPPGICHGLAAHEWGTFTTFAAADGEPVPFSTYLGVVNQDGLPPWVYSYGADRGAAVPVEWTSIKDSLTALVRMETPVIYFYTPEARTVDVSVTFPSGRMTEFYPPPTSDRIAFSGQAEWKKVNSALQWKGVRISPESGGTGSESGAALADAGTSHYREARATDAAMLTVRSMGRDFSEKFLFYRGVADFAAPVRVQATGGDRFDVVSALKGPISAAWLVESRDGRVRFNALGAFSGRTSATLAPEWSTPDALGRSMRDALVREGLYEKEAAAMVATWRKSWFGESGTRVMYVLPGGFVDEILPLTITPRPEETKRVFVGRAEVITPEGESALRAIVGRMEGLDGEQSKPLWAEAEALMGRFAPTAIEIVRSSPAKTVSKDKK